MKINQSIQFLLQLVPNQYELIKLYEKLREQIKSHLSSFPESVLSLNQFDVDLVRYNEDKNNTVQNFLLDEIAKKSSVSNYSNEHKKVLAKQFVNFSTVLMKSNNFLDLQNFFIKYLRKAEQFLAQCDEDEESIKLRLIANFRLGVYSL